MVLLMRLVDTYPSNKEDPLISTVIFWQESHIHKNHSVAGTYACTKESRLGVPHIKIVHPDGS
jgi:hypothetical protein